MAKSTGVRQALAAIPTKRLFLLIFVLVFTIRLVNMVFYAQSPVFWAPTSDEFEHFNLSRHLAGGDWLGADWGPYHRPQFFAYFQAIFFAVFGAKFFVTHIVILLADSLAIFPWLGLARRAFPKLPAVVGVLFIAVYWPFIHFSGTGYMESFAMMMMAWMLYFLAEHARSAQRHPRGTDHWKSLVAAGLIAGLAIMTRPTVMIVMPGIGIGLLWLHWRLTRSFWQGLLRSGVYTVLVLVGMSPNAIRHLAMYDLWAPTGTNGSFNFNMANNRDGWGWEYSSPGIEFNVYTMFPVIEDNVDVSDKGGVVEWWENRNRVFYQEHTSEYLSQLGVKVLRVLNAYEVHCTQNFQHLRALSPITRYFPGFWLFAPLGFVGLLMVITQLIPGKNRCLYRPVNFSQRWTRLLLVWWFVSYLFGVALFLAIARHRLPALPPLILLSGWAFVVLVGYFSRKQYHRLALWGVVLLAGIAVTRLPVIPDWYPEHERWWTQINLGVAERSLDDNDAAVESFTLASEILPDKLESWKQLGISEFERGNYQEAIQAQKTLLAKFRQQYPEYYMIEAEIFETLIRYQFTAGALKDARRSWIYLGKLVGEENPNVQAIGELLDAAEQQ